MTHGPRDSWYIFTTYRQKQYLIGSLQVLAQSSGASPVLQATHLRLLLRDNTSPKRTLRLARRYSAASASPDIWLARLDAENTSDEADVKSAWASARAAVDASSDAKGAEKVWLWGLDHWSTNPQVQQAEYEVKFSVLHGIPVTDFLAPRHRPCYIRA
jgi:U3 small nucleolar RNA-associated protein 6